MVIFWPSTVKVFFCKLGFQTRFVWRIEKLTLLPNCLPLPVSSHCAAIILSRLLSDHFTLFDLLRQYSILDTMLDIANLLIILACILVSMTLHEAMHAYAGYWLGDDTAKLHGRLTLNPLAHIDPIMTVALPLLLALSGLPPFGAAKPVPFNPFRLKFGELGAALVGAAGPLTNLGLAIMSAMILRLFGAEMEPWVAHIWGYLLLVNASFFLFNIIPFPPLDGSRVLYAIAPDPVRRVMERIETMGPFAILLFFLIFWMLLAEPFSRLLYALINTLLGGQVSL